MNEPNSELEDLLDIPTVAELLHVSPRTVNRLIGGGNGDLHAIKIGNRWKIRAEDIKQYLLKKNAASVSNLLIIENLSAIRKNGDLQKDVDKDHESTASLNEKNAEEKAL